MRKQIKLELLNREVRNAVRLQQYLTIKKKTETPNNKKHKI